jgi:FlaA1/EpsC-like NDP-sugar epimerase
MVGSKLQKVILSSCPAWILARAIIWSTQLAIFAVSGALALLISFDFRVDARLLDQMALAIPIWVIVKAVVFHVLRLERGWWRYISVPDLLRIIAGNLICSGLCVLVIALIVPGGLPPSVFILDMLLCTYATGGIRLLARVIRDPASRARRLRDGKRVLIYGAGTAGIMLLREIRATPHLGYDMRGFIDDNPLKQGILFHLTPVLGAGPDLKRIVALHRIAEVLIAIPSASGPQMTRILRCCHEAGVACKTVPALSALIKDHGLANQIRDVAVEDLLSRSAIRLDESGIRAKLKGAVVLITGAAGSIGSEICRQIAQFHPDAVVAYDVGETPLFHLEQEMRATFPHLRFYAELGTVQNPRRLAEVFGRYRPRLLYHAAAYKHVPVMEAQLFEAVENNVLGTWNVAVAAAESGISDFVMISSDKAVHPTSVMGVTKRLSELLITSLHNCSTKYVSVRFGNVLGSNGSVIPIFKKQIAAGGPVCVTHPEMRRYFMTIAEAVQLVLQASTMGKGGEIFVLDMGQPVKIVDLARNLILLSGLQPDKDIAIQFTGIRPGEKLYEEVSTAEEDTLPTYHDKIKILSGGGVPVEGMEPHIQSLREFCLRRDARHLIFELKSLVPEYNPSSQLLRQLLSEDKAPLLAHASAAAAVPVPPSDTRHFDFVAPTWG